MMDENDSTGDGEWGNDIWVMGTGVEGGGGGGGGGGGMVVAGRDGRASWVEINFEITSMEAGS